MEASPAQFFRTLKSYWRRRTYVKLQEPTLNKKRSVRLGRRNRHKLRSKKVRTTRTAFRFPIKFPSLTKLLVRVRNIYVESVLKLAGETKSLPPSEAAQRVHKGMQVSGVHGEFERRMMMHIYRNLVAPKNGVVC